MGHRAKHRSVPYHREQLPAADGSRCARPAAAPAILRSSRSQPCRESAPRLRPITRVAPAPGASRASQRRSSSCRAGLPIRTGGLDQIPAKLAGRSGESGSTRADVGQPGAGRVGGAQRQGALVHVDRPDRRAGGADRQGAGDRAVTAADVEQVAGRGRGGRGLEQEPGSRVEAAGGEHPGIGLELQVQVGQHDPDQPGPVRDLRLRGEVVLGLRQRPTGCCGALAVSAASAGWMKLRFTQRSTTNVITGIGPRQHHDDGLLAGHPELLREHVGEDHVDDVQEAVHRADVVVDPRAVPPRTAEERR